MKSRSTGGVFLRRFVELGGLTPDEAVLEPGCGTGRMAEPLSRYLTTGSYDGFDIVADAIKWCEKNVAPSHPRFSFKHVDVFNRYYNPDGGIRPEAFEFPYPPDSFGFALLVSVFTHMVPADVRRYMGELERVLRPGGRCLMTFFLLEDAPDDEYARRAGPPDARNPAAPGHSHFPYVGDGYRYVQPQMPEAVVGYREGDVRRFLADAGLELQAIQYGNQDLVLVRRD